MNLLDRFGDWLSTHDRGLTRLAWLFLLLGTLCVAGRVAV